MTDKTPATLGSTEARRRRHEWREAVTDAWRSADHAWWLTAEAATNGYATELREYAEKHPRPRLKDFMTHMSYGDPEVAA